MAIPEVIKGLLENGVHFGHLSKHWNPKMKRFIFGKKKNIYIIDLEKTEQQLNEAKDFMRKIIAEGKQVLFVSTKKQLKELVRELAVSCAMPYVIERWVGGFLTNFETIQSRVRKYISLLEKRESGELDKLPGKERVRVNRDITRLEKNYKGIVDMRGLPGAIYVIDPKKESACVKEAKKLGIPVIGLIDTDADPEMLDCPIPGNDDAIKSVRYITSFIVDVIKETVGNIKKEKETVVPLQENEEKKDEETQADNLNVDSVKEDGPDA